MGLLSSDPLCLKFASIVLVLMMLTANVETRPDPQHMRKLMKLVQEPQVLLTYHNGPILSGSSLPVYLMWYGNFSDPQKSIVRDFFSSFQSLNLELESPTVSSWWKPTRAYVDSTTGSGVPSQVYVEAEMSIMSSDFKGKSLRNADIEDLVLSSMQLFPANPHALYLILTAEDVRVEDFCKSSCASHFATRPVAATGNRQLPFAWVGNAVRQCAGRCSWPFAKPEYGPQITPLLAPNGDVGMDGMITNIATVLAGASTNPFGNGFYQGDGSAPLETASACSGIFGEGAYPGYPGDLMKDPISGTSFNVFGVNDRRFLLPGLWDPFTLKCTFPARSV